MLVNSISKAVALKIAKELSMPDEKRQIIEYGMISLMSQLLTITFLLAAGIILGILKEVIIIAVCSAALRNYSGGAHCSSPLRCALLSMMAVPLLVLLGRYISTLSPATCISIIVLTNLLSAAIYYIYSPKDSPAKPIKNKGKIRKLKIKSVALFGFFFIISIILFYMKFGQAAILVTLGCLNQAVTLTKPGHMYIHGFDRLFKIITP